jgi:hypothetical protein
MAIPWLKIEATLPKKPEVLRIAAHLKTDRFSIVGRLVEVWAWADQHSIDGNAMDVTEDFLNELAGHKHFCTALRKVGWLSGEDGALTFPNFDRHNGTTAKTRATGAKRQDTFRGHHKSNADTVTKVTPPPLRNPHKSVTRSDQIRSEDLSLSLPGAQAREGERLEGWPKTEAEARQAARELGLNETLAANVWLKHETRQQWPPGGTFADAVKLKDTFRELDAAATNPRARTPQQHPTPKPADALHAKRSERYGY